MSNAVFPTLSGQSWDKLKSVLFNTGIQRSVNMSELRTSFSSTPLYTFTFTYDLLRDDTLNNELKSLMGFFMQRYGSWDSFLFSDPDDSSVTAQAIGAGDGATTQYQLIRSYGGFNEPVANVNAITSVTVSNTPTSNYSVSSTGLVTFTTAPAANAPLAWTGTYYYRCRFSGSSQDQQDYNQFMRQLWESKEVQFVGTLGTKI